MPRRRRFIPDGSLVEITFRTMGSRLLLHPTAAINAMILGVLARALALYDIALHAFVFMTNHGHLLATTPTRAEVSLFLAHLEGNIARGFQRETGWDLRVWGGRASIINVVDDDAAVERLEYILSHGPKEGLARSPLAWPGVSSARALIGGEKLTGTWIARTRAYEASRCKRPVAPSTYTTVYPIELAPLPCWRALSTEEHQRRCRAMIDAIEAKYGLVSAPEAPPAVELGAAPRETKRAPAPPVHASTRASAFRFLALRRAFIDACHAAAELQRAGLPASYPPGAALPPVWSLPRSPRAKARLPYPPPSGHPAQGAPAPASRDPRALARPP